MLKKLFYFPVASYFAFFAKIRLVFWKPKVIVVTGSSGKTTLLYLIESQLGKIAKYSYRANSSYGIPFDILGIKRKDLTFLEWPLIFLKAPFQVFNKLPKEKLYVVEADCDRPFEGRFLGWLLAPNATLWVNTTKTHSMNFEKISGDLLESITSEFGEIAKRTKDLLIYNQDQKNLEEFVEKIGIPKAPISLKKMDVSYGVRLEGSVFDVNEKKYIFEYLLPQKNIYQLLMTKKLVEYLGFEFDKEFTNFKLPPGRSSLFKGIRNTTIVDSTYNANLDSMTVMLDMFGKIKSDNKWVILGDMLEQGRSEKSEHIKLGKMLNKYSFRKIILMGPRVKKYTSLIVKDSVVFETPDEVWKYLNENIKGGEVLLFKGARFLEGVIEKMLVDKKQSKYLVRREKVWEKRRKSFGL